MTWSILKFGKRKGKTLPQIVFFDPGWFFWAIENEIFNGKGALLSEAEDINKKARNIRIPQNDHEKMIAEYRIHMPSKKFDHMEIIPDSQPRHDGPTRTYRSESIDLSIPYQIAPFDKLGYRQFISDLKFCLFGNPSYMMTKKRCEAFFEDDGNFDL